MMGGPQARGGDSIRMLDCTQLTNCVPVFASTPHSLDIAIDECPLLFICVEDWRGVTMPPVTLIFQ